MGHGQLLKGTGAQQMLLAVRGGQHTRAAGHWRLLCWSRGLGERQLDEEEEEEGGIEEDDCKWMSE